MHQNSLNFLYAMYHIALFDKVKLKDIASKTTATISFIISFLFTY